MSSSTKVKAVRDLLGNQSMPYGERRRLLVDMIIQAGLPVPVEVTSGARAKYGSLRAESWKFLLSLDLGDAQREYLRMVKLGDVPERIRILHDIKAAKERKDQLAKITSWATVKRVLTATMWYLNQLLREKPSLLQVRRIALLFCSSHYGVLTVHSLWLLVGAPECWKRKHFCVHSRVSVYLRPSAHHGA